MEKILKRKEIVDELSKRTGFYKKYVRQLVIAYEDMIFDNMLEATFDEPTEIHLRPGVTIGSKRMPEREAFDPYNQKKIMTPETVTPYAKFTQWYKYNLTNKITENLEETGEDIDN